MGQLFSRVLVETATVGIGTIALGAAIRSSTNGDWNTFAEAGVPNGALVSYEIIDGHNFAEGEGIYSSSGGGTLTRDAAEISWDGAARGVGKLALSGNAKVFLSPRPADLNAGALILLQSQVFTSPAAAMTFTGIDASYDEYELHLNGFMPQTQGSRLRMQFSTDNGVTFDSGATDYQYAGTTTAPSSSAVTKYASAGATYFEIGISQSNLPLSAVIEISRPSAGNTVIDLRARGSSNANEIVHNVFAGIHRKSAAMNALRLFYSGGNVTVPSRAKLYGVR